MSTSGKITPLGIIAAFVTLTETTLVYAVTKVNGVVQITLAVFVITFALLVFTVFCWILWHRANIFYPPNYGEHTPEAFRKATTPMPKVVGEGIEIAAFVRSNPNNEDAHFRLIDSLLDPLDRQLLVLMHQEPCELLFPEVDNGKAKYEIEFDEENSAVGQFNSQMLYFNVHDASLEYSKSLGAALIEAKTKDKKISLTESGHKFVEWLVKNQKKASYMKTGYGGWGEPSRSLD